MANPPIAAKIKAHPGLQPSETAEITHVHAATTRQAIYTYLSSHMQSRTLDCCSTPSCCHSDRNAQPVPPLGATRPLLTDERPRRLPALGGSDVDDRAEGSHEKQGQQGRDNPVHGGILLSGKAHALGGSVQRPNLQ